MSELKLIVGLSNSGKDWIAENRYGNFKLLKCNQAFKTIFEEDHKLSRGLCNDKGHRNDILEYGPLKGMTLQDGMVMAYHQSQARLGYGSKFTTMTILSVLNEISECSLNRTPVVITDVRKPTELKILVHFAEVIGYGISMVSVISNKATLATSDSSLPENLYLFEQLTGKPVEKCYNNY
jgi:hypothetical protein